VTEVGPDDTGGGRAQTAKLPEDKLYEFAKKSFDQKNYETARDAFEKFLETYPDSDKADNARFWIGEIYFREEWYEKAILEYQKVIDNYPEGNKVAAAYLKQGISFQELGENGNAKLVLKELIRRFPESNEANIARQKLNRIE
jgi:tol-pal system protein YbgF